MAILESYTANARTEFQHCIYLELLMGLLWAYYGPIVLLCPESRSYDEAGLRLRDIVSGSVAMALYTKGVNTSTLYF